MMLTDIKTKFVETVNRIEKVLSKIKQSNISASHVSISSEPTYD